MEHNIQPIHNLNTVSGKTHNQHPLTSNHHTAVLQRMHRTQQTDNINTVATKTTHRQRQITNITSTQTEQHNIYLNVQQPGDAQLYQRTQSVRDLGQKVQVETVSVGGDASMLFISCSDEDFSSLNTP